MDNRNVIIVAILSFAILIGYNFLVEGPRRQALQQQQAQQQTQPLPTAPGQAPAAGTPAGQQPPAAAQAAPSLTRDQALAQSPRIVIDAPRMKGSIALKGAKIDDISLADYHETIDDKSPKIILLKPSGMTDGYYADFGWIAGDATKVPGPDTVWKADQTTLTPTQPVTLRWDNGEGLRFALTFALDNNFLLTVSSRVENTGTSPVTLQPYGRVVRQTTPHTQNYYILHEGAIGVLDNHLTEIKYKALQEDGAHAATSTGGWLGITDKYWLVALIPDQKSSIAAGFKHRLDQTQRDIYQTDYAATAMTVAPGQTVERTDRLFAGAKEVKLLDRYGENLGLPLFDRAVDFGWFYFLTKPIFRLLDFVYGLLGNFGISILILTVLIKLLLFPLANKSYRAMSRMKNLQPEMQRIRERYKDDRQRQSQEMMALYRREKVNPAAGCLPLLVQIPVFFSLYKVLFVTIEMRHAPFFGWIQDLSAPDPTTVLNLFGLLPWARPELGFANILNLGVWPLVMGFSMWLQQRLNPTPPDPVQAKVFAIMPFIFTFMLSTFPAGLVIYWAWNNTLSIIQQKTIMYQTARHMARKESGPKKGKTKATTKAQA